MPIQTIHIHKTDDKISVVSYFLSCTKIKVSKNLPPDNGVKDVLFKINVLWDNVILNEEFRLEKSDPFGI